MLQRETLIPHCWGSDSQRGRESRKSREKNFR